MPRPLRETTQRDLDMLCTSWGIINMERNLVRRHGARKAALAISRALKSLDGAIRHAKRALIAEGKYQDG
jgi:hypothetical protein